MKDEYKKTVSEEAMKVGDFLKRCPELRLLGDTEWEKVLEAENYALLGGGKHTRAVLAVEFYKLFSGHNYAPDYVYEAACAIEMTHTFSLIHDDMPEMDNDEIRRGRLAVHAAYGSAIGLLAGDGLAILTYEILSRLALEKKITFETSVRLINILSKNAGNHGMIAGQELDLWSENRAVEDISEVFLRKMSHLKTGRMLIASCLFGAVLAEADNEQMRAAEIYAENVGLAFQIVDDILDVTSTSEELGKPTGSDADRRKPTFVDVLGLENAQKEAKRLSKIASDEIMKYHGSELLSEFAEALSLRKK